jgi:hypothetical protein
MTDHPITPPPELLDQWANEYWGEGNDGIANGEREVAIRAARWGADQELEACCEWLDSTDCDNLQEIVQELRAARRPKPPSLKEQALLAIDTAVADDRLSAVVADVVRRALEALPND